MESKFELEKWFKSCLRLVKVNWIQLVYISIIATGIFVGGVYFLLQELQPLILELINKPDNYEAFFIKVLIKLSSFFIIYLLYMAFIDLFIIHLTSQWYTGVKLSIEKTVIKALSAMPLAIVLEIVYILMAFIASMFCFFPVIFVIVYFLFIFQALIIEEKGLGSFGRSIDIVKKSFGNFLVIPFIIGFVFQFIFSFPLSFISIPIDILDLFSNNTDTINTGDVEKMNPADLVDLIFNSPYTIPIIGVVFLFLILQSNLKSFLYTVAFEEARKDRSTEQAGIIKEDKFS